MAFFKDRRWIRSGRPTAGGRGARQPADAGNLESDADLRSHVERLLERELGATVIMDDGALAPLPVTVDRLLGWITDYGYSYFIDSDGDVGGLWNSRVFYFLLFGHDQEILQVRGQWNREISIERVEEVLEFCNDWNTDRIWPKAYFRVRDNGMIQVYGEVAVDLEHGASDDQLDQMLTCGLSTGAMLFDALDEIYPDPARTAP